MLLSACSTSRQGGYVMSVQGKLLPNELGTTLVHERVTTDFIGAEKVTQPQYERKFALETILPHLQRLKEKGVSTLVECTPNYIGRDVRLLRQLAEAGGLQIITNTGYYAAVDKKYLPQHVYEEDAATIADRWEKEWLNGIDGTGIRPGFIKLGVGKGPLDEVEEKLLVAGIQLSKKSGLPIYVHTGDGAAARSEYEIIIREGLEPERVIWVHAQNGTDADRVALAQKGVWISLDGVSASRVENYVKMLRVLKNKGLLARVLISHDDGWSVENQNGEISLKLFGNGNTLPYRTIWEQLIPQLRAEGWTNREIEELLVQNPRKALTIQRSSKK
jgi:phosphotriesterase-related protein